MTTFAIGLALTVVPLLIVRLLPEEGPMRTEAQVPACCCDTEHDALCEHAKTLGAKALAASLELPATVRMMEPLSLEKHRRERAAREWYRESTILLALHLYRVQHPEIHG